jgi:hypothetical protein
LIAIRPTDRLHVRRAGDAVDHGAENDRADHHLDQPDEGIGERLHRLAPAGPQGAERDAEHEAGEHLEREIPIEGLARRAVG